MRKTVRKHHFNLIEIALAMGVLAVGLVSVMGVFPIAMNSSRDAIGDNEMANAADTILNYIQAHVTAERNPDWTDGKSTVAKIPTSLTIQSNPVQITGQEVLKGVLNSGNPGLFYVITRDNGKEVDAAVVQIWKEYPEDLFVGGKELFADNQAFLKKCMVTLVAEVSYPATLPYNVRKKRIYRMDMFNPHSTL